MTLERQSGHLLFFASLKSVATKEQKICADTPEPKFQMSRPEGVQKEGKKRTRCRRAVTVITKENSLSEGASAGL